MSNKETANILDNLLFDTAGKKLTDEQFSLPKDIDFMQDSFSVDLLNGINRTDIDYPYYLETPFSLTPGYYDEQRVFIIKATPYNSELLAKQGASSDLIKKAKEAEQLYKDDGDTVYFMNDTIVSGNSSCEIGNRVYSNFEELIGKDGTFGLRFLGMDTPEIPHFMSMPLKEEQFIYKSYEEIKNKKNYFYQNKKYTDSSTLVFYEAKKDYFVEVDKVNFKEGWENLSGVDKVKLEKEKAYMCTVLVVDSSNQDTVEAGISMAHTVRDMMAKASDMRIMVDHLTLSRQSKYDEPYNRDYFDGFFVVDDVWKSIMDTWERFFSTQHYKYLGLNLPGQENNKRFLGTIYLKVPVEGVSKEPIWINLTKYIIQNYYENVTVLPDYNSDPMKHLHNGFASDAFKLWTYDFKNAIALDAFTAYTDDPIKERDALYERMTGVSLDVIKQQKLIIGDTILIIPPTSIRCVSQTQTERLPLLRSRGAALKSAPKSEKLIELDLYFNSDAGINGIPYEVTYPNGKKATYWMNGLRSLIAQFKLTPFLPIENNYINGELNTFAVTLVDLQVNTMQGYPSCLHAKLTLQEFNYRVYMPELPTPEINTEQDLYINMFSRCIHYPVMRWYYQRLLQKGEEVKNLPFNSFEYINETFGKNTALIPMDFQDSKVEFYLPDKNWLDYRLQTALEKESKPLRPNYPLTENLKELITQTAPIYKILLDNLKSKEAEDALTKLMGPAIVNSSTPKQWMKNPRGEEITSIRPEYQLAFTKVQYGSGFTMDVLDKVRFWRWGQKGLLNRESIDSVSSNKIEDQSYNYKTSKQAYIDALTKGLPGNVELKEHGGTGDSKDIVAFHDHAYGAYYYDLIIPVPQIALDPFEKEEFIKYVVSVLGAKNKEEIFCYNSSGEFCVRVSLKLNMEFFDLWDIELTDHTDFIAVPHLDKNGNQAVFHLDDEAAGFKFLAYCDDSVKKVTTEDGQEIVTDFIGNNDYNMQDEMQNINKHNNLESAESIKFVKYELGGEVNIESLSCVYSNSMARVSLSNSDGYAHQFCGGQDVIIEAKFTTKNETVTRMLSNLPQIATNFVLDYKMILGSWPLRIESQITRLFGVNEVLIESVDTTTVPNHPGVYAINVRMVAVDRSTRNRETLKKISGLDNSGPATSNNKEYQTNSFFDLNKVLGQAEIYPDLELPTVDELEYLGYKITKFYNQSEVTRKYLDPDFYFVYGHSLVHEIIRSAVMKGFASENSESSLTPVMELSDKLGASYSMSPSENQVFETEALNETAKLVDSEIEDANNTTVNDSNYVARQEIFKNLKDHNKLSSRLSQTIAGLQTPIWYITENMTFPLREKQYETVLDDSEQLYKSHIKTLETNMSEIISQELGKAINQKDFGVSPFLQKDIQSKQMGSVTSAISWAESRIKKFTDKFVDGDFVNNLPCQIDDEFSIDWNEGTIEKMFIAYADACTGLSYHNPTKKVGFISTEDDKNADKNWKLRPYMNVGEKAGDKKYSEMAIPYCKTINSKDSQSVFANTIDEGVKLGYSFGVFQVRYYEKEEILLYIHDEKERKRIKESKLERFFLDDYYRNLQLTKPDSEELVEYKRQMLVDPAYSAHAFARNLMFWYKSLMNDKVVISMYEAIKKEAVGSFGQFFGKSDDKLQEETEKVIEDTFEKYINVFASSYARVFVDNPEAKTQEGMDDLGLPPETELRTAAAKFKDNTDKLLKEYKSKKEKAVESIAEIDEDIANSKVTDEQYKLKRELLNDIDLCNEFIKILETNSKEEVVRFGSQIAIMKNTIREESAINNQTFKKVQEQLKQGSHEIVMGKLFGLSMISLNGGGKIYSNLKSRNTEALSSFVMSLTDPSVSAIYANMRKYMLALDGRDVIKLEYVGIQTQSAEELINLAVAERVMISRSDNPDYYLRDSYLDMIKHDKRGRMLRAFPTYYMLFIDEGRKIGLWKIHDNFYNMNAISEITVTKSRKNAVDTAQIVMSNMFKTYSESDAQRDYNEMEVNNVRYNMRDAFNSIFSPRTYYMKEEMKRDLEETAYKGEIKPGTRIHLRLGYGANAAELPTVFNGNIAEVGTSDIVDIVAQGDGAELLNPIMDVDDSSDLDNREKFILTKMISNWLSNGGTPREIMTSLLMARGTWMQEQIRKITKGRFYNYNPYGIVHFGDVDFTNVFKSGEVAQNIFEANPRATYGQSDTYMGLEENYDTKETPCIAMHLLGKTFWDVMHVCSSAQPEYIASIVPFGLRSSVFYGAGRYYYAYDYEKADLSNGDTMIMEKRKPFQQSHFYTSFSDIIHNSIKASAKEVKTNAVGLYQEKFILGMEGTSQVGPLYTDFSIYPEFQKSMTVDTQLWAKGMPILGNIFGWTADLSSDVSNEGWNPIPGAKEIAWRMTANALKDSMKDMYTGEISIIGDATVKPYDSMWIQDVYERMTGSCEVEGVVHTISTATGFTSSIYPDCISVVDDRFEQYASVRKSQVMGLASTSLAAQVLSAMSFDRSGRPLIGAVLKSGDVMTGKGVKLVDSVGSLLGKTDLDIADNLIKTNDKLKGLMAIGGQQSLFLTGYLDDIGNISKAMSALNAKDFSNLAQLQKYYSDQAKMLKDLENPRITKELGQSTKAGAKEALEEYTKYQDDLFKSFAKANKFDDVMVKEVELLIDALNSSGNQVDDIVNTLYGVVDDSFFKSSKNLDDFAKAIKKSGEILDDGVAFDILKTTRNTNKTAKVVAGAADDVVKGVASKSSTLAKFFDVTDLAKLSNPYGWALMVAEAVFSVMVGAYASEWVHRYLKNLQVLQIFPLKRKGRAFVAGLDGHKGLVVGSPTYNQEDEWTNFMASLFDGKPTSSLTKNVLNFFISNDKIEEAALRLKKDNGVPQSEAMERETLRQKLNEEVGSVYASKTQRDMRYLIYHSRVKTLGKASRSHLEANVIQLEAPYTSPKNSNLATYTYPIREDEVLKAYFENGFLDILYTDLQGEVRDEMIAFQTEDKSIEYLAYKDGFNVPCLRIDAMIALRDCVDQLAKIIGIDDLHYDNQSTTKVPDVQITSALELKKDKATWESTGLAFRLQIPTTGRAKIKATEFLNHMKQYYKDCGADNFIDGKVVGDAIVFVVKPTINY